jgi:HEAT repeat protein
VKVLEMGGDANGHKRTIAARADPRSTQELISIVLTGADEDTAWEAVTLLHWRGTREVFDAARQLCASECPKERVLGADILGQLGIPERSFPDEALAILTRLLLGDRESEVLSSAAIACGHLHDARAVGALVKLKNHPNEDVRYAIVFGLLGHPDRRAVRALIKLSADPDADVRDWATFGLGQQIDTNTREVREALYARIDDEDDDTRAEALMGLARRHDERVIEPLIEELGSDTVTILVVEAAGETGDPRLYSALAALRGRDDVDGSFIEEAIARCLPDDRRIGPVSVVSTDPSASSLLDAE